MCNYKNCKKQSIYNFENEKQSIYYVFHKLENMINIKSKTCIYENCTTQPTYNFENEKKSLYCFLHKLENMINVKYKNAYMKIVKKEQLLILKMKEIVNFVIYIN